MDQLLAHDELISSSDSAAGMPRVGGSSTALRPGHITEREQFVVGVHDGRWVISHNSQRQGPFRDQRVAIRTAINQAYETGRRGQAAQVLVQGWDGQLRAAWTHGRDPCPPRR